MAETDIVVELPEEGTVDETGALIPAEKGIADLHAQLAEAQKRADDNAENLRIASMERDSALRTAQTFEHEGRTQGVERLKGEINTLKAQQQAALEEGEYGKATDLAQQMGEKIAERRELEREPAQQQTRQPPDMREQYLSQLTPPARQWMQAHPEYLTGRNNFLAVSAHNKAMAEDIKVDTPEYFSFVEKELGLGPKYNQSPPPPPPPQTETRRNTPPITAPVSRTPPGGDGRQQRVSVSLSKDELEMAALNGQTPQQYAAEKYKLQQSGQLGQTNNGR